MKRAGLFITVEGVDGCGKSTQAALLAEDLAATGREVVRLRDPGSTRLSEKIRLLLLWKISSCSGREEAGKRLMDGITTG